MSELSLCDLYYNNFEKYFAYYNKDLCEDGRLSLCEAAKKICADENLLNNAIILKNKLADLNCDFKSSKEFDGKSTQFAMFVYTLAIEDMEKLYKEQNIPHNILIDTIRDMYIWIEYYHKRSGEWGLSETGWLTLHIRGKVFRIGRLQFEKTNVAKDTEFIKNGRTIIKEADPVLNVHIPEDGKLDEKSCIDSFETAKDFYINTMKYDFKAFCCFTWLFDTAFESEKLLPINSNILKFQKLFTLLPNYGGETDEALRRVFVNITRENIKDAPKDTYFRRTLSEYVQAGGKLHSGGGYRLI